MVRTLERRRAGVPDGDARRRARPRPLGVPPLDELPLGGRRRRRCSGSIGANERVRRARGVHREARPGPLGRGPLAEPQGAQGDARPRDAARRGVGEGRAPARRSTTRRTTRCDVWAGVVPLAVAARRARRPTSATTPGTSSRRPHVRELVAEQPRQQLGRRPCGRRPPARTARAAPPRAPRSRAPDRRARCAARPPGRRRPGAGRACAPARAPRTGPGASVVTSMQPSASASSCAIP